MPLQLVAAAVAETMTPTTPTVMVAQEAVQEVRQLAPRRLVEFPFFHKVVQEATGQETVKAVVAAAALVLSELTLLAQLAATAALAYQTRCRQDQRRLMQAAALVMVQQ